MTRTEILFNYRQAIKQAEKLEQLSKRLNSVADRSMEPAIATLRSAWRSDHSEQYYSKAGIAKDNINKSAANLNTIAASIRRVAKAVRDAELRALEVARKRSY